MNEVSNNTFSELYHIFGDLIHELDESEFDRVAILYDTKDFDALPEIRSITYKCIDRKRRYFY